MRASFTLDPDDFKGLERAIAKRLQRERGRLNLPYFVHVCAWMFTSLAVFTFAKQWQRDPVEAAPYGVVLLFAVLGFMLVSVRPFTIQRLYWKYVLGSISTFTKQQTIEVREGSLLVESTVSRSVFPQSAFIDHLEDARNHYLFLTGVQALIIPKSADPAIGSALASFLARPQSKA